MSDLLTKRSLERARQLVRFRLGLVIVSLIFFSLGLATILLPIIDSLPGRFKIPGRAIRVLLWSGVGAWLYCAPQLLLGCLKSVEGIETPLPPLGWLIRKWHPWLWLVVVAALCLAAYWFELEVRIFPLAYVDNPLEWAVYWMAAAIVAGALIPVLDYLRNDSARNALKTLAKAATPQYRIDETRMDDATLYQLYLWRSSVAARRGFRLDNVPIYFVVPPKREGYTVDIQPAVRVYGARGQSSYDHALSMAAARRGLDWAGFSRWQQSREETQYLYGYVPEDGVSVRELRVKGTKIEITGTRAPYRDFLVREVSTDLSIDGILVRDVLEEPTWTDDFDLSVLERSSGYYCYFLGVNALYCTSDGFLVLQRRATTVRTGPGNLGASVAGSLRWRDVAGWFGGSSRSNRALLDGVLRETREELGIRDDEVDFDDAPCTGMGLNLRHGRDPNVYVFGELKLCHSAVSNRRRAAVLWEGELGRDTWEWDHLLLIPVEAVSTDGSLVGRFEALLGDARHLRAALFAAAQNGKFQSLQAKWRADRKLSFSA